MEFTDVVLAKYPQIDPTRVGMTGGSYGGFMACMDIEADDEIASKDYYKDLKAYMDAGKVRSTLWNQLPSGASDVLGDDVQGYFAGITDEDQTLDALDEGFKKLAEE